MASWVLSAGFRPSQSHGHFSQKQRVLSLFSFIGELYNMDMLTAVIVISCFNTLLTGSDATTMNEERLEVMCMLLMKTGKRLSMDVSST